MEFNNDSEWLRQRAAAEDGCDVSVGTLPPSQLLEEMVKLTNENYQMLVDQTPAPGPEAPHECTCGRCQQTYTSTMPNWAEGRLPHQGHPAPVARKRVEVPPEFPEKIFQEMVLPVVHRTAF
jgi:hypothetical protein